MVEICLNMRYNTKKVSLSVVEKRKGSDWNGWTGSRAAGDERSTDAANTMGDGKRERRKG